MKVRILVGMAGPTVRHRGDVVEVDDAEAGRLIAAGYAEPLAGPAPPKPGPARSAKPERGINPAAAGREKAITE